ncbi:hypothetical protein [Isoptericola variabilis]|uniref:Uncharacterized protein n=1 Tax=Isoptericola variabilis (strain 225) TaxID=743718 RepID=F6FVQ1_ISOV2|nr:hypothetical protein [Isoptericola variabilis]AEG45552.1 hypothetical protein Isova_2866 [Isoptericola variabilis 225]TWH25844.1 hypothetical protein L600_000900000940 [Isoptericola variabilis J7]
MTREQISRRWDLVGRLVFVAAMCFCVEMLVYVVQMFVALAMQENFGSTGVVATVWRWLAWGPALVYASAVLISLPLPRWRGRETRWSAGGRRRVPPMGRGMVLFFGPLLFLSTAAHSISFLSTSDVEEHATSGSVVYLMVGAIGLLLLRIVLGALRLVPRSWRVLPDAEPPATPDVVVPEQRFAPDREPRA